MKRFKRPHVAVKFLSFILSFTVLKNLIASLTYLKKEIISFLLFLYSYFRDKTLVFSNIFEKNKNSIVKSVLIKRGKRNRFFLHVSAMAVLFAGVLISPFITDSNPFSNSTNMLTFAQSLSSDQQSLTSQDVFQTQISDKPRDSIITYTVQKGDTLSGVAKKFGISEDTIKWQNDLKSDNITVGDTLEILPVTGIAHKVTSGETIYTIAKKYNTNPQGIVDFPFNDFADPQTFSLVVGETIIVPNGVAPAASNQGIYITPQQYIPKGPVVVTGAGFTWPVHGTLNQYFSWYHRAVDLGSPIGTPVIAAQTGTVSLAITGGWNTGYGTYVIISGDNGYQTLYAHMEKLNVSSGERVTAGQSVIGWVGVTGNSTGPHLHFEIRSGSNFYDPLSFLH
jgi:murein DD-endopeptidase MepM/ murein hydrolase activator NlpD